MRVRLTIEYDNDEGDTRTTSDELQAWLAGDITVSDVLNIALHDDKSARVHIEEVKGSEP